MSTWQDFLKIYRDEKAFNPQKWVEEKTELFNNYLKANGLSGAVVSVSGGVDSATILMLLKRTLEMPDSALKNIVALSQPIHSSDWAFARAKELCDVAGLPLTVIDQTDIHKMIVAKFTEATGSEGNSFTQGQLRSYLRTPANYYAAQLLSAEGFPAVVIGTGNQDEDRYLAYFCKYGDGAVDVQLIADLHKSEVFKVAKYLGVPQSILVAAPSADLWDGQTDEEEMGFSYDFIEFYTGYYLRSLNPQRILGQLTEESKEEFVKFEALCTQIHRRNAHKLAGVINL
jgi:NAD+ synthase (glutamine-hydrolysing)